MKKFLQKLKNIFRRNELKKIIEIYKKYEEIINYLVIGGLTTLVNLIVKYALLFTVLKAENPVQLQIAVIVSWIIACLFAYITNRKIVFKSKSEKIIKEFVSFVTARLITLGMEMLIMYIFVTVLRLNSNLWVVVWSIVAQVVVVVANYVFSKLFIFKKLCNSVSSV